MPHLIVEHSANVADLIDISTLVDAVHQAALGTGVAPLDALRTRAAARLHYRIGDGHSANAFVAVVARLGLGRTDAEKQTLIDALLEAVDDQLGEARRHVMLSVEYQEIDPTLRANRNHLRSVIAERQQGDHDGR